MVSTGFYGIMLTGFYGIILSEFYGMMFSPEGELDSREASPMVNQRLLPRRNQGIITTSVPREECNSVYFGV